MHQETSEFEKKIFVALYKAYHLKARHIQIQGTKMLEIWNVNIYSGDLKYKQEQIVTNFYLFAIQMPVFKWHSNTGTLDDWTTLDYLNTRLVLAPFSTRRLITTQIMVNLSFIICRHDTNQTPAEIDEWFISFGQ